MKLNKNDMMQRLTELSPRERLLSTGTVLLVLSYGFYQLIYTPIADDKILFDQKIEVQKQDYQYLKKISMEVTELRKYQTEDVKNQDGQSLLAIIDLSSLQMQIKPTIKRVIPDDANKVTLWLEDIQFDQFIDWLIALESMHGITVNQINITPDQLKKGWVNIKVQLSN
jgi:general secretion pathway protein M